MRAAAWRRARTRSKSVRRLKKGASFFQIAYMLFRKRLHPFLFMLTFTSTKYILMDKFKIRAYGLQELAMLYFPNSTPQSASNQLKKWMMKGQLPAKLHDAGYTPGQKILTPRQVEVITGHVGEP